MVVECCPAHGRAGIHAPVFADDAGGRSDVDDHARLTRLHGLRDRMLAAIEHAVEIDVDGLLPEFGGTLLHRCILRRADDISRIVNQDIQAAELGQNPVDDRGCFGFIRHLQLHRKDPAPRGLANRSAR